MFIFIFFSLFTIIFTTAYIFCKLRFQYWKKRGVYTLHPSVPFGNTSDRILMKGCFFTNTKNFYLTLKKKGLHYGGFYFATNPVFLPVDLDLIKDMMTTNFQHFMDRAFYSNPKADPLTAHLIFLKGEKWKRLRAQLSPTFSAVKLKAMFETLSVCLKKLEEKIESAVDKNEPLEMKTVLERSTANVICSCVFGIEVDILKDPNNEFYVQGSEIFKPTLRRKILAGFVEYYPHPLDGLHLPIYSAKNHEFFLKTITDIVDYRKQNRVTRRDFLELLMQMKKSDPDFTMDDMASQLFVFFIAGYETAASTATFLLYELSCNSKIQDKLRAEIIQVLDRNDGKVTYDALSQMTYLNMCIEETLRKHPSVPNLNRICTKDYKVPNSNLVIEKGTVVVFSAMGIQNDPKNYPNPDIFDPERFTEEAKKSRHPYAWIPFGEGPRICIGLKFAILQIKAAVVTLLKNHKISINPRTKQPMTYTNGGIVTSPEGGIWINITRC